LYLYFIGTVYEISRLEEGNVEAVVSAYDKFLTNYAEDFVRKSKTENPGRVLAQLAEKAIEKKVKEALETSDGSKTDTIASVKKDYETRLTSEREAADRRLQDEESKTEYWKDEAERIKEMARQLNTGCKNFNRTLNDLWAGVLNPIRPNVLII
jgi:hypothetical protein